MNASALIVGDSTGCGIAHSQKKESPMLFTYTEQDAREEVANIWSQLGRFTFDDLNQRTQESIHVLHLEGRHRFDYVRDQAWRYADLNEDAQDLVDMAVEANYRGLIEENAA